MTPSEAVEAFEAAAEAWATMADTASHREATYHLTREDAGADPVEVVRARLAWGVAHVGAAQLWVERCAARDRLQQVERAHTVLIGSAS